MGLAVTQKPIALYTHFQHRGVGQRGSEWSSQPGQNALLTVAFHLKRFQDYDFVSLNKSLSVAIATTLGEMVTEKVQIKWPNDILCKDAKLAGLLMETAQIGAEKYLLMGLGVNVNQTEFPQTVFATSLCKQNRQESSPLLDVQKVVLANVEALFNAWNHADSAVLLYDDLLYKRNKEAEFLDVKNDKIFTAVVKGVNQFGQVCLQLSTGEIVAYHHGQVRMQYLRSSNN